MHSNRRLCFSPLFKMHGHNFKWHRSYLQVVHLYFQDQRLLGEVDQAVVAIQVVAIQVVVDQAVVDQAALIQVAVDQAYLDLVVALMQVEVARMPVRHTFPVEHPTLPVELPTPQVASPMLLLKLPLIQVWQELHLMLERQLLLHRALTKQLRLV